VRTESRRRGNAALAITTVIVLVPVLVLLSRETAGNFDAAEWRADRGVGSGIRLGMADQLIANGTLRNMTMSEVVALLGEDDREATPFPGDPELSYLLGPARPVFEIDDEFLQIKFGPTNRVQGYWISYL